MIAFDEARRMTNVAPTPPPSPSRSTLDSPHRPSAGGRFATSLATRDAACHGSTAPSRRSGSPLDTAMGGNVIVQLQGVRRQGQASAAGSGRSCRPHSKRECRKSERGTKEFNFCSHFRLPRSHFRVPTSAFDSLPTSAFRLPTSLWLGIGCGDVVGHGGDSFLTPLCSGLRRFGQQLYRYGHGSGSCSADASEGCRPRVYDTSDTYPAQRLDLNRPGAALLSHREVRPRMAVYPNRQRGYRSSDRSS